MADYDELCVPTTADELRRLRGRLETHVDVMAEAHLADPSLPSDLADRLATGLTELIDLAGDLDTRGRSLVRGAAVYFLMTDDASNDLEGPHGRLTTGLPSTTRPASSH